MVGGLQYSWQDNQDTTNTQLAPGALKLAVLHWWGQIQYVGQNQKNNYTMQVYLGHTKRKYTIVDN